MTVFHEAMDYLDEQLQESEDEKSKWKPVGDVIIENLQDEIDLTKVIELLLLLFFSSLNKLKLFLCFAILYSYKKIFL